MAMLDYRVAFAWLWALVGLAELGSVAAPAVAADQPVTIDANYAVSFVAFAPDGQHLVIPHGGKLQVRSLDTGELVKSLPVPKGVSLGDSVVSADGTTVAGTRVEVSESSDTRVQWVVFALPSGEIR